VNNPYALVVVVGTKSIVLPRVASSNTYLVATKPANVYGLSNVQSYIVVAVN
jgi:hypothetical protein